MKKKLVIALCLVVAVTVVGCRSRSPNFQTVSLPDVSDDIVKLHQSLSPAGTPVNMNYQHPREFSEEALKREIDLLVVMEHKSGEDGVGNNWIGKPVFTETAKEELVPALAVAFIKASRSDKILINAPGRGGKPTRGGAYVKDGKLIWAFQEIDGVPFTGDRPDRLDSKDWWIEETQAGMTVRNDEKARIVRVERDLKVEPEIRPEVVLESVSQPPGAVSTEVTEEGVSRGADELDEDLDTLKEWKDGELITDEDTKEKAPILE
jgi:hypothetical protein